MKRNIHSVCVIFANLPSLSSSNFHRSTRSIACIRRTHHRTHTTKRTPLTIRLQQFITSVEGIPADDQLIFASGHVLDAELFDDLTDGCQIEVTTRLLGGKVHGSLARAGKVKGQTPKVEKQVKKRKKCGRARRRILYQKRFVNVVNQIGKQLVLSVNSFRELSS